MLKRLFIILICIPMLVGCAGDFRQAQQKAVDLANAVSQFQVDNARIEVPRQHLKPLGITQFTCGQPDRGSDYQRVANKDVFLPSILQRCSTIENGTIYNFVCELYPGREGCSTFFGGQTDD